MTGSGVVVVDNDGSVSFDDEAVVEDDLGEDVDEDIEVDVDEAVGFVVNDANVVLIYIIYLYVLLAFRTRNASDKRRTLKRTHVKFAQSSRGSLQLH